jgi:hypothetical protein
MNKKKLTAVIILIVVVIVAIGVLAFHNEAKAPEAPRIAATSTGIIVQASSTGSSTILVVLTTSTKQSYGNSSFSFSYPAAWSISAYTPFSITNFGGKYNKDGTLPPGGAVISVVTTTVEQGYLSDIMSTQLMSATNLTTTTLVVDGIACPTASFEAAYAPGATSKNISAYCERGSELWEIYLSYGANDAAAAAHASDFNGVIDSMKLLP